MSGAAARASEASISAVSLPALGRGQLVPMVYERIAKAIGPRRATEVLRDALAALGDRALDGPQDLLALADLLIKSTGLVQAVGRSLKVQALLRGAVES